MKDSQWDKIKTIVDTAMVLAGEEKESYLKTACQGSPDLLKEVQELLRSIEESEKINFLEPLSGRYQELIVADIGDDVENTYTGATYIGKEFGAYRILESIGEGGMGTVYKAERTDGEFHHTVAIKLIKQGVDSKENIRRFKMEREVLARLNHPNIAQLFDGGVTPEGIPYLVMEFVDGVPIDQYCNKHRLTIDERLNLFKKVCAAVQYAHNNLVIHRDLKNQNIFVNQNGVVKILDFGVAKLLADPLDGTTLVETQPGQRFWTPQYAAPEQVKGAAITTATDIYTLGILLYKLLVDAYPLDLKEKNLMEISRAVQEEAAVPPSKKIQQEDLKTCAYLRRISTSELVKTLSGDLDALTLKAIRKEPEYRYHSVGQLLDDLDNYQKKLPLVARNDTIKYRIGKLFRRHKMGISVAAVFLILAIGFAVFYSYRITAERTQAQLEAEKATEVTEFMLGLFEAGNPNEAMGDTLTARHLLRLGTEQARALNRQPEVQAQMLGVIGRAYYSLALYENADTLFTQALQINRQTYGEVHPEVAKSQRNIADLYRAQGVFNIADSLYSEVLVMQENLFGEDSPEIAQTLNSLAITLRHMGEYETADSLYNKALTIRKTSLGTSHPLVSESLSGLASTRYFLGDYETSENYYREALQIQRNTLPENHSRIATTLNDLGALLDSKADYEAAESLYLEALQIQTALYGDVHPYVALTMNNLAVTMANQGKMKEAQETYHKVLEIQRKLLGEQHPRIALTLNNLGMSFYFNGDYASAEPYLREAVVMSEAILDKNHPDVGSNLNNLAQTLFNLGQLTEASQLQERAVSIHQRAFTKPHPRLARSIHNLAKIKVKQHLFAESERLFLEALEQRVELLGNDHPDTQTSFRYLAELYDTWNKPEKAAEYRALIASRND